MSKTTKTWSEWLVNSRFSYMSEEQKKQTLNWLFEVRDKILDRAKIKDNDTLIDIGTGTGLLSFRASEILKDTGKVIASDAFEDCLNECKKIAEQCDINNPIEFLHTDATKLSLPNNSVNVVVMRSVLVHILDKQNAMNEFYRVLNQGGRISIFEPIIKTNTKYYELIEDESFPNYQKIKEAEIKIMSDSNDPLTNFDAKSLEDNFKQAGFKNIDVDIAEEKSVYVAQESMIEPWFNTAAGSGNKTMKERFAEHLSEQEVVELVENLKSYLNNKEITLSSYSAYISAEK